MAINAYPIKFALKIILLFLLAGGGLAIAYPVECTTIQFEASNKDPNGFFITKDDTYLNVFFCGDLVVKLRKELEVYFNNFIVTAKSLERELEIDSGVPIETIHELNQRVRVADFDPNYFAFWHGTPSYEYWVRNGIFAVKGHYDIKYFNYVIVRVPMSLHYLKLQCFATPSSKANKANHLFYESHISRSNHAGTIPESAFDFLARLSNGQHHPVLLHRSGFSPSIRSITGYSSDPSIFSFTLGDPLDSRLYSYATIKDLSIGSCPRWGYGRRMPTKIKLENIISRSEAVPKRFSFWLYSAICFEKIVNAYKKAYGEELYIAFDNDLSAQRDKYLDTRALISFAILRKHENAVFDYDSVVLNAVEVFEVLPAPASDNNSCGKKQTGVLGQDLYYQ